MRVDEVVVSDKNEESEEEKCVRAMKLLSEALTTEKASALLQEHKEIGGRVYTMRQELRALEKRLLDAEKEKLDLAAELMNLHGYQEALLRAHCSAEIRGPSFIVSDFNHQ